MKKMKSRIASICLALCLAALMAGCAGVEKKEEKTGIKIGAVSYTHLDVYKRQVLHICKRKEK